LDIAFGGSSSVGRWSPSRHRQRFHPRRLPSPYSLPSGVSVDAHPSSRSPPRVILNFLVLLLVFDSIRNLKFSFFCSLDGEDEADLNSKSESTSLVPFLSNRAPISPLPKDTAMGLALSAATGRGWTTGSGMEGPPVPADTDSADQAVLTFPWSLYTRSPRRRMRVVFTCNVCGQRTTRAINPHAYTDGTVFVQVHHALLELKRATFFLFYHVLSCLCSKNGFFSSSILASVLRLQCVP
ncbi:hypothetical protein GW17_00029491, partial [Ensete ventricosum]